MIIFYLTNNSYLLYTTSYSGFRPDTEVPWSTGKLSQFPFGTHVDQLNRSDRTRCGRLAICSHSFGIIYYQWYSSAKNMPFVYFWQKLWLRRADWAEQEVRHRNGIDPVFFQKKIPSVPMRDRSSSENIDDGVWLSSLIHTYIYIHTYTHIYITKSMIYPL